VIDEALKSPFSSFFEKGLLLFGAVLGIFWVRFCEVSKKMAIIVFIRCETDDEIVKIAMLSNNSTVFSSIGAPSMLSKKNLSGVSKRHTICRIVEKRRRGRFAKAIGSDSNAGFLR
jgi:hypothetical protein